MKHLAQIQENTAKLSENQMTLTDYFLRWIQILNS